MIFANRAEVAKIKREFPRGSRVVLDRMNIENKPPIGGQGTVTGVDDRGCISVAWDSGKRLGVLYGEDECHVVSTEDEAKATLLFVAAHQKDGDPCPRCGSAIPIPHTRALSRRLDILICEACGSAEAIEDLLAATKGKERTLLLNWTALGTKWWGGGE